MSQKVCIDKASHDRKMMATIEQMRNEGDHCDFSIKAGNKQFRVHRNIMSAGSEYFRAMLRHETLETQNSEVEMKDMDPECLKSCIDFIYTAACDIPDRKVCDLLHASHIMQLDEVQKAVFKELENKLSVENFFQTRRIARLFNNNSLLCRCDSFGNVNFVAISSQSDFQNESKEEILAILNKLFITDEEKLQVLMNWVGGRNERKSDLLEILKSVDLKNIPEIFLENLIENNPPISNDSKLCKVLNNAVKEILRSSMDTNGVLECSKNGKSLIFCDAEEDCLRLFDPKTNEVTVGRVTTFPTPGNFTAIHLNSYIYLLCDDDSAYRLNWNDSDASWKRLEDMKSSHGSCPPAVATLGSIFVIGSDCTFDYDESQMAEVVPSSAERLNPISGEWMEVLDRPQSITNSALAAIDGTIYCAGGWINDRETNSFWRFSPLSSEWQELPPMKNAKFDCRAETLDQKVMVFGGSRDWNILEEAECFNFVTSQWSVLPLMPRSLDNIRICLVDGSIYAGECNGDPESVFKYDVGGKRWKRVDITPLFYFHDIISI